jgi:hypothetical protein
VVRVRACVCGQVLYMWSGEHGRRPYGLTSDEQARLVELKNAFLKKHNLRDNFLTDDFLLCVLRARVCVRCCVRVRSETERVSCACGPLFSSQGDGENGGSGAEPDLCDRGRHPRPTGHQGHLRQGCDLFSFPRRERVIAC